MTQTMPERDVAVVAYHPDPEINAEVIQQANEGEEFDLSIGYPPRAWTCPCGATHARGHFGAIGIHRCLSCGYVGDQGVLSDQPTGSDRQHDPAPVQNEGDLHG